MDKEKMLPRGTKINSKGTLYLDSCPCISDDAPAGCIKQREFKIFEDISYKYWETAEGTCQACKLLSNPEHEVEKCLYHWRRCKTFIKGLIKETCSIYSDPEKVLRRDIVLGVQCKAFGLSSQDVADVIDSGEVPYKDDEIPVVDFTEIDETKYYKNMHTYQICSVKVQADRVDCFYLIFGPVMTYCSVEDFHRYFKECVDIKSLNDRRLR